ncbi:MAG: hypothetical protein IH627_13340 [Rubrivivax sp.]|nr:hypothetical protein [Rubrivivax sp.]
MNMTGMPWIGLTALQPQRYHHLAWFLYGWIEREHVLNMNACANWWIQAFVPAARQFRSPAAAPRTRALTAGAIRVDPRR